MKKTRQVSYLDPSSGKRVTKTVDIPSPAKVANLSCGAAVQEIESMEALTSLWSQGIISDLVTPLTSQSRQALSEELKKSLTGADEHLAIDALAQSWKVTDDVVLKVLGRLTDAVQKEKVKQASMNDRTPQLLQDKAFLEKRVAHLVEENKTLHTDVAKVVNERDALKAHANQRVDFSRQDREAREARASLRREQDDHHCTQVRLACLQQALTQALTEGAAIKEERDAFYVDVTNVPPNRVESFSKRPNQAFDEVLQVNNSLQETINALRAQLVEVGNNTKVQKECDMSPENENVEHVLHAGDEVFCKVSGEGPFVLMTQVDEALIEYANPISNRKNSYNCGKLPIFNAWLVRCKDGSMRTFPAPALTHARPKSSMSFGGIKALVTSDVTGKMFQAAIWITMLTLLYMRG